MRGLRKNLRTMDERTESRERGSAGHLDGKARRRGQVLVTLLDWPNGTGPLTGAAPEYALRSLAKRGLVEVRFHLTADGRREALKLKGSPDAA